MPPIESARASLTSSTILATCSGASFTPGISGAISTPVLIPARFSSATASIRFRGWGVCGSVSRHAFSSSVGIERLAENSVRSEISFISFRSRTSSGDFVSTEHGLA